MKYTILLLLLACTYGEVVSQTNRTSRTKRRAHNVDSVSSWQLQPLADSTRQYDRKDSLGAPRSNKP